MPSTTRGSILISTANDIGEALVEKLGGVGYSPNEWKDKFNLCGIAPVDSAPALSVLSDSAGTGDERGSILIATADAIGAILNKKYNVLRGFKPIEWASACRKMKALEEGSVASSSIASFSDGADTVPLTSCEVALPASLDGYSSVDVVSVGKNLFNYEDVEAFNANVIITRNDGDYTMQNNNSYGVGAFFGISFHLKPASYSLSLGEALSVPIRIYKNDAWFNNGINAGDTSCTFTVTEEADYTFSCNVSANSSLTIKKCQLEVGSTATAYEPYTTPETKTADLGRTIYGGSADIITGEGKETSARVKISDLTWSIHTVSGRSAFVSGQVTGLPTTSPKNVLCDVLTYDGEKTIGTMTDKTLVTWTNTFRVYDTDCEDVTDFFSTYGNGYIVYQLIESAQVDFTFEPVKIDSFPGVNNIWNDCGNTAVEYYQAPTPYARKTATGGIANFSDQRTDLPLTKAIANIAPSIAGKSAVILYQGSEPYQATTTYTAELGETVYGGSVDFVSGEVEKTHEKYSVTGQETGDFLAGTNNNGNRIGFRISGAQTPLYSGGISNIGENKACLASSTWTVGSWCIYTDNKLYFVVPNEYTTFASALQYLVDNQATFVFPLATPTESAIPGRVISPIEGVNNYWNDAGGDTEIQYFEDET